MAGFGKVGFQPSSSPPGMPVFAPPPGSPGCWHIAPSWTAGCSGYWCFLPWDRAGTHVSCGCYQRKTYCVVVTRETRIVQLLPGKHVSCSCYQGNTYRAVVIRETHIVQLLPGRRLSCSCYQDSWLYLLVYRKRKSDRFQGNDSPLTIPACQSCSYEG